MWSGGDDFNDEGEAVRLYQPILYGPKPSTNDLTSSFIGGLSINEPVCSSCQEPLHLLVQLFVPCAANHDDHHQKVDRTLQVFACNRAACIDGIFSNGQKKKKLVGGDGVVTCRRLMGAAPRTTTSKRDMPVAPQMPSSTWAEDHGEPEEDHEWSMGGSGDHDVGVQSLEAKLAAMETSESNEATIPKQQKQTKLTTTTTTTKKKGSSSFPCYFLHCQREPTAIRTVDDEDDVGISGSQGDKIQQMLSRYMAEEEDEDILAALHGSSGGGGGGGEKDERLSAADRALLTFSDRMKRSPRQVVRYALGGVPLWSM